MTVVESIISFWSKYWIHVYKSWNSKTVYHHLFFCSFIRAHLVPGNMDQRKLEVPTASTNTHAYDKLVCSSKDMSFYSEARMLIHESGRSELLSVRSFAI